MAASTLHRPKKHDKNLWTGGRESVGTKMVRNLQEKSMSTLVKLHHRTVYKYDRAVCVFPQVVRLRPAAHTRTPILNYNLRVLPGKHFINWQQDPYGNFQARIVLPEITRELSFTVDLTAELHSINPFDFFLEPEAENFPFRYAPELSNQLAPFLAQRESGPLLSSLADEFRNRKERTIDFLVALNQAVKSRVQYLIRMEPGVQTCEDTLTRKSGSCRDSAFLLVQLLRRLGLAARFASGYLIQLVPDEKPLTGPPGPASDFTDLHAWAEVFLPGAGWIGLDATSGLFTAEGHIPLACSAEPLDAAPVTGSTEPCTSTLEFEMSITRFQEGPRVTKPFTEEEWKTVESLGRSVDHYLESAGVSLTIGGEPTFVSEENRDLPEWNIAANGVDKKKKACDLAFRLRNRFFPGGVLHSGQGKWYPGEELPRWAYTIIARTDGQPVWRSPGLLANEGAPAGHGVKEAEDFVKALAFRLAGRTDTILAGVEDAYYYLWKEGSLPLDADLRKADLGSEKERLRILNEKGLGSVTGFALPLSHDGTSWRTSKWTFKRGALVLLPGDSPMGFRLPLESLSGEPMPAAELSPIEVRPPFPDVHAEASKRFQYFRLTESAPGTAFPAGPPMFVSHTALCVEARGAALRVFLPPLSDAAQYLDLIAAVEQTALDLRVPVAIEGYEPPSDPRLTKLSVTPDPGVVEVNIHPSSSWQEHAQKLEALYEEAKLSGLTSEKFMVDGRRSGTGGGNHIVLGGPHPSQSIFLRNPRLLPHIVVFFQNHPSLSYFFNGMFTGPTSQAPRIDEGHPGALYDLSLSLQEIEKLPANIWEDAKTAAGDSATPLWLLDRLLRHLLTDHTGNTHRTEISIDKLYSPDSLTGRLGLVEFRAFEMPYHPRMNALQGLLVRAVAAAMLKKPAGLKLVDHGLLLEDRYRLPAFLFEDLSDALDVLRSAGFHFNPDWFRVFLDARFPLCGRMSYKGIQVELRTAVENWTVLGEEMFLHGTARAVDAAVERLEVRAFNYQPERNALFCNGREIPMRSTRTTASFAGGVRFKAWAPPRTMHPSLPAEKELVFEIVDNVSGEIVSSSTYNVSHPGGRAYDTLPVNEREAESRTLSRFRVGGKSEGTLLRGGFDELHPHTLDLRRRHG